MFGTSFEQGAATNVAMLENTQLQCLVAYIIKEAIYQAMWQFGLW